MIVRSVDGRLQLITQPDHARLALRVMERCVPLRERPRADAILLAIREHDNGWTELDAAPMVDSSTGRIADFITAPVDVRQQVWPRGVGRIQEAWAASLVAEHALTIYDRYRGDPEWSAFFATMESMRDERLCEAGGSLDDLVDDYAFVRLGDLISLAFCTGWTDAQRFGAWTVQRFDARVVVTPDAFGGRTIPFEISARELPDRPFTSDADLRDALRTARVTTVRGELATR
jgi:Protein of unknown function (DUF3891)